MLEEVRSLEKIKLELGDWLYNAALMGFRNILKESEDEELFKIERNYIEFDVSCLENFEEKYFNYFFNKYKLFTVYGEIVDKLDFVEASLKNLESFDEKKLEILNNYIEYVKSKLKRDGYKAAYPYIKDKSMDLLEEEKRLKKIAIKKKQNVEDVVDLIKERLENLKKIIAYLNKKEVRKYVLAKDFIYSFTNAFLSGVGVWDKNSASKDPYMVFKEYFLENIKPYVEKDKSKYKHTCSMCSRPVKGIKVKNESYDLTWINYVGVDGSRKSNHYWNYNNDTAICPICNLIYSCIPAGVTYINGKGFFINSNKSFNALIQANNFINLSKTATIEELEEQSYYQIIDALEHSSSISNIEKEIQNIQVIKYDSNNDKRPYTFNILSKKMILLIADHKEHLKKLLKIVIKTNTGEWLNIYQQVLKRLYDGKNLFDLIHTLIVSKASTFYINIVIKINNSLIGGNGKMLDKEVLSKRVNAMRSFGEKVRKIYVDQKGEPKKIDTVVYKLLNAIKTKNAARFSDVIINTYMYVGEEIPTIFTDVLKDEDILGAYGYSFIIGLKGSNKNNEEKGDK